LRLHRPVPRVDYAAGDPFFGPGGRRRARPTVRTTAIFGGEGNRLARSGFTNLKTFDFSKEHLGWDNDYYTRDFVNYNVALEKVPLEGPRRVRVAFDYQDSFRRDFAPFNFGNAEVILDIQENTLASDRSRTTARRGFVAPQPNPNYGRPFVITKASPRTYDSQREGSAASPVSSNTTSRRNLKRVPGSASAGPAHAHRARRQVDLR
jgi:hypothetical protein